MIRPTSITKANVKVVHDDKNRGHSGTVPMSDITLSSDMMYLALPCPTCESYSVHPVSGGGEPELVQKLFLAKIAFDSATIPELMGKTPEEIRQFVRERIRDQDGEDRYRI